MEKLTTITTLEGLKKLKEYLADKDFIAFDTETDGVERDSHIIGFSVSADVEEGFYVILMGWDTQEQKLKPYEALTGAKDFCQSLIGKSLIMHNSPFDCSMVINNYGVDLLPSVHTDTMILGHLLNENRQNGLKELGISIFGEDAAKEQKEMKASVHANGGVLTKEKYEMYKCDPFIMARYGAKDAILTLKLFYEFVPKLYEEGLADFFYRDESMPLLKGPTYDLNTVGLRVDSAKLEELKRTLEVECMEAKAFIYKEIDAHVKKKYPGTNAKNTFNINSGSQRSWLLYFALNNEFSFLTKEGKVLCKALSLKLPYTARAKRIFIQECLDKKGRIYQEATWNKKTKKMGRPKKIKDPWNYISCGKDSLEKLASKYKWVEKYLEYAKAMKLLTTYVIGIQTRMRYGVIRPSFFQHGTTSGRYSSRNPNFQNLPRDDKRVKACIIAGKDCVFVGADYSQLEPRIFASRSGDSRLQRCFADGDDFYSVVGAPVFGHGGLSLKKEEKGSFAKLFPEERQIAKEDVVLASVYGTTAYKMSASIGKPVEECQEIIDSYFTNFPSVHKMMLDAHKEVKRTGKVYNLFGRPRRIPEAMAIPKIYGNAPHSELPYAARTLLNLAVNHTIQSTAASIVNRAAIAFYRACQEKAKTDSIWKEVKMILQVHDEIVVRCPTIIKDQVSQLLKECMENTTHITGVALIAEPKIGNNLAECK